ncbi:MAG: DUF4199 domain-containing protein [Bacteriovoracaceae bacterium]|nr:DUF4199 domain-containing protein [Bacteroidota bacterium]
MKIEYRYGALCGLGLCGWVLVEYALGFHTTSLEIGSYSGYGSMIIPAVMIFSALREHQKIRHGILLTKDAVNIGFTIAIVSAGIITLFMAFYNSVINPEWIDAMVEWQRRKLILAGATDDQIEQFMGQNRRMNNTLGQAVMSFIGTTGLGVFFTIINLVLLNLFKRQFRA